MSTTAPDVDRSKAQVLADVRRVCSSIGRAELRRDRLYARRLDLFREARSATDRVTLRELAEAADVSETVVINALKKLRTTDA